MNKGFLCHISSSSLLSLFNRLFVWNIKHNIHTKNKYFSIFLFFFFKILYISRLSCFLHTACLLENLAERPRNDLAPSSSRARGHIIYLPSYSVPFTSLKTDSTVFLHNMSSAMPFKKQFCRHVWLDTRDVIFITLNWFLPLLLVFLHLLPLLPLGLLSCLSLPLSIRFLPLPLHPTPCHICPRCGHDNMEDGAGSPSQFFVCLFFFF